MPWWENHILTWIEWEAFVEVGHYSDKIPTHVTLLCVERALQWIATHKPTILVDEPLNKNDLCRSTMQCVMGKPSHDNNKHQTRACKRFTLTTVVNPGGLGGYDLLRFSIDVRESWNVWDYRHACNARSKELMLTLSFPVCFVVVWDKLPDDMIRAPTVFLVLPVDNEKGNISFAIIRES